jgi:hypothetical protein
MLCTIAGRSMILAIQHRRLIALLPLGHFGADRGWGVPTAFRHLLQEFIDQGGT